jgi:hypothetical protein
VFKPRDFKSRKYQRRIAVVGKCTGPCKNRRRGLRLTWALSRCDDRRKEQSQTAVTLHCMRVKGIGPRPGTSRTRMTFRTKLAQLRRPKDGEADGILG